MPDFIARRRIFQILSAVFMLLPLGSQGAFDPRLLEGMAARELGPAAVSGRISSIDALESNPNHIVIGVATGGVWISENGGLTWTPVFDDQPVASIGAVAINQKNPDIIWVGTGEGAVRNSTSIGGGLFKTIDGGHTWKQVGLETSERINRIALHPDNPDIVYVAALGTLWGENSERGIFKTTDGGTNWAKILYVDERTGGTDVKIDPFNPDKIYASLWQHRRWPYFFKSGGPGSGLYISWDGGATWSQKTEDDGLPAGELGRITIAPSAAEPGRVYALVEAEKSAMLRSTDGGEHWTRVNEQFDIAVRPFYYTEVAADPANPDRVYNIESQLRVSIDGGKTFEINPVIACCDPSNTIHIDNHAFWINPGDPKHQIIGNDGGIAISRDRGETWRFVRNLPLSQFYHIAVDNDHPYNIYGGLQDNGSWRGPSEVWENGGIRNLHWQEVGFGDGFDTLPDPQNSRRGYVMSQGGYLVRWDLDTGEQRLIRPDPQPPETDLRFNWNSALAQDPFDPATIYYGSQFVHKSTDRGNSWAVISPDLTSNDPSMQTFRQSGGLTPDVTAAENHTTIVAIAPSPIERGTIWVGSDDGRVHVTRDGGQSWARVDTKVKGVTTGAWVPMIAPSPHEAGTAFVVFDDHRRSDMKPYAYRVDGYGDTWTNIVTPDISGYALSVLQDPVDSKLLFIGTEFGLYFSVDAGASWTRFTAGLPTVSVMDMAIQKREADLVLGTHGRSVYVIDDYSALRTLGVDDFKQRLKILSVTPGQQYVARQTPSTRFTGSGEFRAANEPYGVMLTYLASGNDLPHPDEDLEKQRKASERASTASQASEKDASAAGDDAAKAPKVAVVITDEKGETVRRFTQPVLQGINRLAWDQTHDGVRPLPGPIPPEKDADLPPGPEVPPGDYQLSLSLGDDDTGRVEKAVAVTVMADPRSSVSAADREANYRSLLELQAMQESAVNAVELIVRTRDDIGTVDALIARQADASDNEALKSLGQQGANLRKGLDALEAKFRVAPETRGYVYDEDRVINQVGLAQFYIGSSLAAETPAASVYKELARSRLASAEAEMKSYFEQDVAAFRSAVDAAGITLFTHPVSPEN
ncbi:MAG TPA: hypothetical protein VI566_04975 [Xanthomonadales bacterium]|nr:hypothetical protein [Xanthomonadales bacterium]